MSWKTLAGLIILIALVFGISKLLGNLGGKRESSASYLEQTVETTKKVKRLKDERSRLINKQEKELLGEE